MILRDATSATASAAPQDEGYARFLAGKALADAASGMTRVPELHPALKPFQRDLVGWALRRGRAALFAGTGLGKTLQQLVWAREVEKQTGGPVLVLTPLAVAQQTVREAAKFDIGGVAYAGEQSQAVSPIVVTNYDRMEKFDLSRFAGVVLDESSIIKSHDGKTRNYLIEECATIAWRLCCTATPSPNDYTELGNHSEFLGVLSQKEMLSMFFVHDGSVRAKGAADWRLKRHAAADFWRWLASWAAVVRSPSDCGYDDPDYELPPLNRHSVVVPVEYRAQGGLMFPLEAQTLSERLAARRDSISDRVRAAAAIVNAQPDRPWLIWCGLNDESRALADAIPGAVEVTGSMDDSMKADRLLRFANGKLRVLVSKPSICGWGLNFQICADMVFVGLNDSFEQMFQAIRRCWRFGQTKPVNVHIVSSELEGAVVSNVAAKEADFNRMCAEMAVHMRELTQRQLHGETPARRPYNPEQKIETPAWL